MVRRKRVVGYNPTSDSHALPARDENSRKPTDVASTTTTIKSLELRTKRHPHLQMQPARPCPAAMANQSNLERLISVITSIVQDVYKSFDRPTITTNQYTLFLDELKLLRTDNARFQQQVVLELAELRSTIGSGLKAFESRDKNNNSPNVREIALKHNTEARVYNGSHYHDGGALRSLVNEQNHEILGFPKFYKDINMMNENELMHLLRAFGLSIDGNEWCRRSRFKYFIGVFQVGKSSESGKGKKGGCESGGV